MAALYLIPLLIVAALAQRGDEEVSPSRSNNCASVRCKSPYPCDEGQLKKVGCCPTCDTNTEEETSTSSQNCARVRCASPYPCDGELKKSGCCPKCEKSTGSDNDENTGDTENTGNTENTDCENTRCKSPYPCDDGQVKKKGCCDVCVKKETEEETDCSNKRCKSPYPCDDGKVKKKGCCNVCIKKDTEEESSGTDSNSNSNSNSNSRDCSRVRCASPYPCTNGKLKKSGCCLTCAKEEKEDSTSAPTDCSNRRCKKDECDPIEGLCRSENQYIKKKGGPCGCCDVCITVVGQGADCSRADKTQCSRRTKCNLETGRCELDPDCPEDVCTTVECGVKKGECTGQNQHIRKGGGTCGCCDVCATIVDVGGDCSGSLTECKAGTACNAVTQKCE